MDQTQTNYVDASDLAIIITTSPIPSNPGTDIIDMAISSIQKQSALAKVSIYIICDGAKVTEKGGSQFKSGIVSTQSQEDYLKFKIRIKEKYQNNQRIIIEERNQRCGFAENIRYVMTKIPHEFVLIFQHDHVLVRTCDFSGIVSVMKKHPINYIGLMNKSVFKMVYELDQHLGMRKYFCDKVDYHPTTVRHDHSEFKQKVEQHYLQLYGMPLMPLLFWYDKVHVARKSYYLDVIFNPHGLFDQISKSYIKTVTFVEDSFGCFMRKNIRNRPAKFEQLSAFILWDSLESASMHSHGRGFMTQEDKDELHQNNLKNKAIKGESSSSEQGEKQQEEEQMSLGFMLEEGQL